MDVSNRIEFTKEMKKEYVILAPNMANIHFSLIQKYSGNRATMWSCCTIRDAPLWMKG